MQNRSSGLAVVALVLAALYVGFFTDWFRTQTIQIIVQNRPIAQRADAKRNLDEVPVYPVSFAFDRKYELTSLKVVGARDLDSQKFPTPLWHLVADTNSRPTKAIVYGVSPAGMRPAVEDSQPQALQPGVTYALQLETKTLKGSTNFIPVKASSGR